MMWDLELEALQQNSQEASLCPQYLLVLVLEIPTRRRRWTCTEGQRNSEAHRLPLRMGPLIGPFGHLYWLQSPVVMATPPFSP